MTGRFPDSVYGHGHEPDARFTLANERTYLAWTRTSLALVAGAVAVHSPFFDLAEWTRALLSGWLLALALLCSVQAWTRWRRTEQAMRHDAPLPGFAGPAALLVGVVVIVLGVAAGVVVDLVR